MYFQERIIVKIESKITHQVAVNIINCITRKTIRTLQQITDCQMSGDDSGLENAWDEICVQIQDQYSIFWFAFDEVIQSVILGFVEELEQYEKQAIWLETEEGGEWLDDELDNQDPVFNLDDIVDFIKEQFVYSEALGWTNKKIRIYLENSLML